MTRLLVLITGTGRSGTSAMAGALQRLGLAVPGPYLQANDSNPKGFYESSWAVRFHKRITKGAMILNYDSQPSAFGHAREASIPKRHAELVAFLGRQDGDQVVIKDPRSVWAQRLWGTAATDAGYDIRYLSMIRHPAEVVGSRTTYYGPSPDDPSQQHQYATVNVARWVNHSLITERETRGSRRVFVRYTDLLGDWRGTMSAVGEVLGLRYDTDLASGGTHAIDDFLDPDLRRHEDEWTGIDVPLDLQQIAEAVWAELTKLAIVDRLDTSAALDSLAADYDRIYMIAVALTQDFTNAAANRARAAAVRTAEQRRRDPAVVSGTPLEQRVASDISARDLIRLAGRRAAQRLRRTN